MTSVTTERNESAARELRQLLREAQQRIDKAHMHAANANNYSLASRLHSIWMEIDAALVQVAQ